MYLNIIEATYDKTTVNIILNGEKLKPFLLRLGPKTRMPTLITFTQHNTGNLIQNN